MKITISIFFLIVFGVSAGYFFSSPEATTSPAEVPAIDKSPSNKTIKIISFGDSLTAGFGLPLPDSYPAQLEKSLLKNGHNVVVINSGVSGETSAGNTQRAKFIRDQNPDLVILGIGGNDALRILPADTAYENIRTTLTTLLGGDNPPQVLLLSIQAPSNAGLAYKKSFDGIYQQLATEFSIPLVPFVVAEVALNQKYLLPDRIHPNKEGYRY